MNTAATEPSRLSCRVVRAWSSLSGRPPAAHCASCRSCQAFFAAGDALENALRRDATSPRHHPAPSIGFEQRLARAVHESQPQPEPRTFRVPLGAWAGVAAAAAIAVAFVLNRTPNDAEGATREATQATVAAMFNAANSLSERWETKVVPTTQVVVTDNPLQQEIDSVVADGQKAVRFLAANFLPTRRTG